MAALALPDCATDRAAASYKQSQARTWHLPAMFILPSLSMSAINIICPTTRKRSTRIHVRPGEVVRLKLDVQLRYCRSSTQHAARSTQHAARSTQHAARTTQHAARSTQRSFGRNLLSSEEKPSPKLPMTDRSSVVSTVPLPSLSKHQVVGPKQATKATVCAQLDVPLPSLSKHQVVGPKQATEATVRAQL